MNFKLEALTFQQAQKRLDHAQAMTVLAGELESARGALATKSGHPFIKNAVK